jgi:hypothetical protein
MIRPASIVDPTFVPYSRTNAELTSALIKQVDSEAKNLVNLNTDFTTHTYRGITYTNNHDGTINVSGTSTSTDSYVTLYDRNTDNLFGIQKGETVVLRSTSDDVSINLVYKKSDGSYGLTVYGYKSTPGWFTIPSDFVGFILRIGVPKNETTVNEDVGGMICTVADYIISSEVVPYALPNTVITPALIKQVDEGAKNLFDISTLKSSGVLAGGSYTNNGVTYTLNSDGTISLSGTATSPNSTCSFALFNSNSPDLAKFVGKELSGGLSDKVYLAIEMKTSPYTLLAASRGGASTIAAPDSTKQYLFYIRVASGENVNGKIISPMICTASDWAVSPKFVSYVPNNRELWQKIKAIKRTYKVPISSTPVNGIYFGVQMFPFEFDSVPEGTVAVQNVGQGGVTIDPTKFTAQINTWGFRIYTTDSTYAGLIPDVKIL